MALKIFRAMAQTPKKWGPKPWLKLNFVLHILTSFLGIKIFERWLSWPPKPQNYKYSYLKKLMLTLISSSPENSQICMWKCAVQSWVWAMAREHLFLGFEPWLRSPFFEGFEPWLRSTFFGGLSHGSGPWTDYKGRVISNKLSDLSTGLISLIDRQLSHVINSCFSLEAENLRPEQNKNGVNLSLFESTCWSEDLWVSEILSDNEFNGTWTR